ncbi:helix-turn-helix domain-containing protein [Phytomonospora endophytica]|uniref:Uncharacterized protein n=1 Tax=Phytomonospora endophytica TaxID=714109 RepID=A0A841FY02_9ACTN|nr:helix-turn-helix domain-containing protein [Phytomonospora endophytica]MBB6038237.1 hypothetical protein [Phytomonospora endophytica]GIG67303.1 hypothetical protein Pen01_35980 [Phytomonospora endophytica]
MPRNTTAAAHASPERGWLTVEQILAELGIPRRTWQEWRTCKHKTNPAHRHEPCHCTPKLYKLPNGKFRVKRSDFDRWLSALEEAAA